MKLRVETIPLRLKETFTISRGSQDVVETVICELERDGYVGRGEASPSSFYGHTAESVAAAIESVASAVEAIDPLAYAFALEEILDKLEGNRAALCAIDCALHDWIGKKLGLPLYRLWGLDPERIPLSSFTVGISSVEDMARKAREASDFPILKVKLGTGDDLAVMRAVRAATRARLRVDANCAWDAETTIAMSRELATLDVEYIEQPMRPDALDRMEEVHRESALPLFADENSVVPEDVPRLAERFHGINIKLVKCGGLAPAMRMIHTARTLGLDIMIGCMIESSVGISAAAQLGPLVDHLDLDGSILIADDPFDGVRSDRGVLRLEDRPGTGVRRRS